MTTLLERRYRTVLRLLPAYYRREREEEMVETYLLRVGVELESAGPAGGGPVDLDLMRPTWREVGSVVALAVRTRMGAAGAPPGYAALGATVRMFALIALLIQAAAAVTEQVLVLAWSSRSATRRSALLDAFGSDGWYGWARGLALWTLPLLWTAAYAALLRGRLRSARACALLAAVAGTEGLVDRVHWSGTVTSLTWPDLVPVLCGWVIALAVCCGFHADASPARLPALPPGLAFMGTCVVVGGSLVLWPRAADTQWATGTAFVLASLVWLTARALNRGSRQRAEDALALAALGLVVLALRIALLADELEAHMPATLVVAAWAQLVAGAVLTGALTAVGTRDLRTALRTG